MDDGIKSLINYFKGDKKRSIIFIIAALGIVLLILSAGADGEESHEDISLTEYALELEEDLSELCSSIEGAGRCKVKVSFASGERAEYRGSVKIGSEPPRVLGVSVIAEGADSAEVRRAISECLCALFDIGRNRVSVQKMK